MGRAERLRATTRLPRARPSMFIHFGGSARELSVARRAPYPRPALVQRAVAATRFLLIVAAFIAACLGAGHRLAVAPALNDRCRSGIEGWLLGPAFRSWSRGRQRLTRTLRAPVAAGSLKVSYAAMKSANRNRCVIMWATPSWPALSIFNSVGVE